MEYSRKLLSIVSIERNTPRTLDLRQAYAREMNNIPIDKLIYLDESGFNLHTTQNYVYSPKNTKAYVTVPAKKRQNVSLMSTISISGIVSYEMINSAYNGD
ncbi:hypothetical protein CDIK_3714 [Cucumispora dikerogammari]|nr:hypothetical protein CDIK_3714 [Cucumispora dikerogammari]